MALDVQLKSSSGGVLSKLDSMNKTLTFVIAFTLGAALTLFAAGEQDHPKWMKGVKTATENTKKAIEAKDADAIATEAKALAGEDTSAITKSGRLVSVTVTEAVPDV